MLRLSKETEQLARLVAVKHGTTPEDVVRTAVESQARTAGVISQQKESRVEPPQSNTGGSTRGPRAHRTKAELIAGMEEISRLSAARPLLDSRSIDEIMDYDDFGLPR